MKNLLFILAAAALACGAAGGQVPEKAQDAELALSLGDALGDFHSTFSWGLSYNVPYQGMLRVELEMFYYFNPTEFSPKPGLAITSTGLSLGLNLLVRWDLARSRLFLETGAAWGQVFVSETWKYSNPKSKLNKYNQEQYLGPAVGLQVRLDNRSGVRFDLRFLYLPWDGRHIPRLSIGYALWH